MSTIISYCTKGRFRTSYVDLHQDYLPPSLFGVGCVSMTCQGESNETVDLLLGSHRRELKCKRSEMSCAEQDRGTGQELARDKPLSSNSSHNWLLWIAPFWFSSLAFELNFADASSACGANLPWLNGPQGCPLTLPPPLGTYVQTHIFN